MTRTAFRIVLPVLLASALASCGGTEEEQPVDKESLYGAMEEDLTQCPGGSTLQGIDVSVWQGSVNWHAVKSSGRAFAVARVAYGTSYDSTFAANWSGMKAAGLVRGAYVFFRPSEDPVAQANVLLQHVGTLGAGDLPPTLDVEVTEGASRATMSAKITAWANRIHQATGRKPIIYSGSYFWDGNVGSSAEASDPLWLPSYGTNCPLLPSPWSHWTIHQYSSTGRVSGVSGNVDLDVFNGTRAQLDALAGNTGCAVACDGKVAVDAQCHRTNCATSGDVCVKDSQGARCINPKCPATGTADVCISTGERGHCANGKLSPAENCAAKGDWCSTAGVSAHAARCVSKQCVANATTAPHAHDACTGDKKGVLACDAKGAAKVTSCAAGLTCDATGGPHCVAPSCPPTGKADVCLDSDHLAQCANGVITAKNDCRNQGAFCSTAGGRPAHCASSTCVTNASTVPVAHDVCLSGSTLAHCDADGVLSAGTACAAGTTCEWANGTASCEAPPPQPQPDAGTPPQTVDAGSSDASPDSGSSSPDSGSTGPDSGSDDGSGGGAAIVADGGDVLVPAPEAKGCHCGSSPLSFAQLALLGLLVRRKNQAKKTRATS